jgi:hypothetical protein
MWVVAILEALAGVLTAPRGERLMYFFGAVGLLGLFYLLFNVIKWSS